MSARHIATLIAALVAGGIGIPASARPAHHRPPTRRAAPAIEQRSEAVPPPIERDGVPGNLPFSNQLRKFSDPLSANGR